MVQRSEGAHRFTLFVFAFPMPWLLRVRPMSYNPRHLQQDREPYNQ